MYVCSQLLGFHLLLVSYQRVALGNSTLRWELTGN